MAITLLPYNKQLKASLVIGRVVGTPTRSVSRQPRCVRTTLDVVRRLPLAALLVTLPLALAGCAGAHTAPPAAPKSIYGSSASYLTAVAPVNAALDGLNAAVAAHDTAQIQLDARDLRGAERTFLDFLTATRWAPTVTGIPTLETDLGQAIAALDVLASATTVGQQWAAMTTAQDRLIEASGAAQVVRSQIVA